METCACCALTTVSAASINACIGKAAGPVCGIHDIGHGPARGAGRDQFGKQVLGHLRADRFEALKKRNQRVDLLGLKVFALADADGGLRKLIEAQLLPLAEPLEKVRVVARQNGLGEIQPS